MKNIVIFLYLLCFMTAGTSYAVETQVFSNSISVPIIDKDIVFARNNAFGTLKQDLIFQAIRELVDSSLLEEYQKTILRHKKFRPNDFINFVKVVKETAVDQTFSMGIEGEVNMELLTDFLRRINFIFKLDPVFDVTLVLDSRFPFSIDNLKKRLKLFRINIGAIHQLPSPLSPIPSGGLEQDTETLFTDEEIPVAAASVEKKAPELNTKALFDTYAENKVLYLVTTKTSVDDLTSLTGINVKILRKKDLQVINSIDHLFVAPITKDTTGEQIESQEEKFLKFFSLKSCKRGVYDAGLESTINLKVLGLNSPFLREGFEKNVLRRNRRIQRFSLLRLTPELTEYKLRSKNQAEELVQYFKQENPFFDITISSSGLTTIEAETHYKKREEISELIETEPSDAVLESIRNALWLEEDEELPEAFIPGYTEQEPNNNSRQFNLFKPEQLILSKISSRADEDIYMVEGPLEGLTGISIDWIRIGRTSLSPQLRLYDQDFKFLNNYLLLGRQNRLTFTYTFPENPPKKIYIRISDKVGFIQGETGGYKSFNYLLKYTLPISQSALRVQEDKFSDSGISSQQ